MFWCCCIKIPTCQSGQPQLQAAFSNVFQGWSFTHQTTHKRRRFCIGKKTLTCWSLRSLGRLFGEIFQNLEYFKVDRKVGCRWLCKYPAHLQTNLHYISLIERRRLIDSWLKCWSSYIYVYNINMNITIIIITKSLASSSPSSSCSASLQAQTKCFDLQVQFGK